MTVAAHCESYAENNESIIVKIDEDEINKSQILMVYLMQLKRSSNN